MGLDVVASCNFDTIKSLIFITCNTVNTYFTVDDFTSPGLNSTRIIFWSHQVYDINIKYTTPAVCNSDNKSKLELEILSKGVALKRL